jgi:hypothetical protein
MRDWLQGQKALSSECLAKLEGTSIGPESGYWGNCYGSERRALLRGSMSRIDLTLRGIDRSYYLCKHFFCFLFYAALTSSSELLKRGRLLGLKS